MHDRPTAARGRKSGLGSGKRRRMAARAAGESRCRSLRRHVPSREGTVGGDLKMDQVFRNGELCEHHFWNTGTGMDLTSSRFDGFETLRDATLLDQSFLDAAGPMNAELVRRLDRFRAEVAECHNAAMSDTRPS